MSAPLHQTKRILRRLIVVAFYLWCLAVVSLPVVIAVRLLFWEWPQTVE